MFLQTVFVAILTSASIADLQGSDSLEQDFFGASIATTEDYVLIGAPSHNNGQGAVYVFSTDTWHEVLKITENTTGFGIDLAIGEKHVFVGTSNNEVYVYSLQNGNLFQVIYNSTETFGRSLDSDGNWLIIGAPFAGTPLGSGEMYIYEYIDNAWQQHSMMSHPLQLFGGQFATDIDIENDKLIAGAPGNFLFSGSAHIYHLTQGNWTFFDAVDGSQTTQQSLTGFAVAIEGGEPFVSSPFDITKGGEVYTFEEMSFGYEQTQLIRPFGVTADDLFSASLSVDDGVLAVGAPRFENTLPANNDNNGAVFIYTKNSLGNWFENLRIIGDVGDSLGLNVHVDNGLIYMRDKDSVTVERIFR